MGTIRRHRYVDFRTAPEAQWTATATGAAATAADGQVDYTYINDQYFELYQGGANAELAAGQLVRSATGVTLPLDASSVDYIEMTHGVTAGAPTKMKFTVGSATTPGDAFYIKAKLEQTTLNKITYAHVGFRELGAYTVTGDADLTSEIITLWGEAALLGIVDNAGAINSNTSVADADVATLATASPAVTGTAITFEVYVSSVGVVSFKIDGAADVLLDAATEVTLTDTSVMVPSILVLRGNVAGGSGTQLVTYECGLQ